MSVLDWNVGFVIYGIILLREIMALWKRYSWVVLFEVLSTGSSLFYPWNGGYFLFGAEKVRHRTMSLHWKQSILRWCLYIFSVNLRLFYSPRTLFSNWLMPFSRFAFNWSRNCFFKGGANCTCRSSQVYYLFDTNETRHKILLIKWDFEVFRCKFEGRMFFEAKIYGKYPKSDLNIFSF